ncbi:uncharacterized protein TNCT_50361 [Trichonephila clavata]|uniref:Uncharacterized protein n=1 Tax=Trichonephila clavata TaxID=2740835 RepID=A0A8X6FU54_TRICU|nr:uncharacterized protein TNCT_50361 [Trichonephila clavata]
MQLPNSFLSLLQMYLSNIALQRFNGPVVRLFTITHDIHACIWSSEEIEALLGEEPTILLRRAKIHDFFLKQINPTLSQEYKHRFKGDGKFHSLPNKQWEILLNQKLSTLSLPNMFKKEIVALVRLVLIESYIWFQDHKTAIKSTKNLYNHFQWTQDNKIHRQKTTKAIIHDDSIDIIDRFILASQYCFQEDVLSIWGILDDAQKNIFQEGDFNIVQIWANWAKNGEELEWEEITRYSRFGLERYFPKLQQEKRLEYLMSYRRGIWINYHELQFCLSILDRNEQSEIFKKCPFPILEVFLDWPEQEKLLDGSRAFMAISIRREFL